MNRGGANSGDYKSLVDAYNFYRDIDSLPHDKKSDSSDYISLVDSSNDSLYSEGGLTGNWYNFLKDERVEQFKQIIDENISNEEIQYESDGKINFSKHQKLLEELKSKFTLEELTKYAKTFAEIAIHKKQFLIPILVKIHKLLKNTLYMLELLKLFLLKNFAMKMDMTMILEKH